MPSELPLISVVLCTYNGEKFLAEQLDSILVQTYSNLELIISDDQSTDGTWPLLQTYAGKDARIKLFRNETNLGYNKHFEKACSFASGQWIAIADQDDIWLPHKLWALYHGTRADTLLVHSYNAEFKNNDPSVTYSNPSRLRFKGNNTQQLFFYNTISGHTMLFHQKLLKAALPFPDGVYYDWWLGVNASLQSKVQLIEEPLVLHRQHEGNISHIRKELTEKEKNEKFFKGRIATLQAFLHLPKLRPTEKSLLREFIQLLQQEGKKKFSWPVFFFFLKHARTAFYYRQKKPMHFYYFKYSWKKASMNVKHWT